MRNLHTKTRKEAKQKRNQIIMGVIIIILMTTSVIGYAILSGKEEQQEKTIYKDYEFIKTNSGWQTQINRANKNIILNTEYLPQEVENITNIGRPFLEDFINKNIFLIISSNTERNAAYIFNSLSLFTLRIQFACPEEKINSSFCIDNNLPIKSCNDTRFDTTIIKIQDLEITENQETNNTETNNTKINESIINFEPSVNYKNQCLIIKGKDEELVKASEKALFMIYNII